MKDIIAKLDELNRIQSQNLNESEEKNPKAVKNVVYPHQFKNAESQNESKNKKTFKDYLEEAVRLGFMRDKKFTDPRHPTDRRNLAKAAKNLRSDLRKQMQKDQETRSQYDDPESLDSPIDLPTAGLASIAKNPAAVRKSVAVAKTSAADREAGHSLYQPRVKGSQRGKWPFKEESLDEAGINQQVEVKPATQPTAVVNVGGKTVATVPQKMASAVKDAIQKGQMTFNVPVKENSNKDLYTTHTPDDNESSEYDRRATVWQDADGFMVVYFNYAPSGKIKPADKGIPTLDKAKKMADDYVNFKVD